MPDLPSISIVTPTFQHARFLEATILSILSQNYPRLQYIIIDGGSDDGTVDIIKKYEKHLHYWCSEPDGGQYAAVTKGFQHATGDILAWINSDDMYYPWTLNTVSSIFHQLPQVDWLTSLQPGWWDYGGMCLGFTTLAGISRQAFLDGCYLENDRRFIGYIQQESTFWRRSLWERVGSRIRPDYHLGGDFDLWTQFYLHADLYAVSSPLGGFRINADQRSTFRDRYLDEARASLQRLHEELPYVQNQRPFADRSIPQHRPIALSQEYQGQRIVRRKRDTPGAFWAVEPYEFY